MKNTLQFIFLVLSGLLALFFLGNFLFHMLIYSIDGSLWKFASPIWLGLNGMTLVLVALFVLAVRWNGGKLSY